MVFIRFERPFIGFIVQSEGYTSDFVGFDGGHF